MRKVIPIFYISGLVLLPLVLIILPADFFDKGQSVCLSVLVLDSECYGCGMTRGIQHLLHFNFLTAYEFNKLSVIVLPLLVLIWLGEVNRTWKRIKTRHVK